MLNQDSRESAVILNAHGLEYPGVGGYALARHGHPGCMGSIERVLAARHAFGCGSQGLAAEDFIDDDDTRLGQPSRRIDPVTGIDGVPFDGCRGRPETIDMDGVKLNFIGLDDIETNKRVSGHPGIWPTALMRIE